MTTAAPGEEITKTEDSITFMKMQLAVTAMEFENAARSLSLKVHNQKKLLRNDRA